ncbi:molecular chaperone [Acinetobacter sp. 'aerobic (ED)']|uniref:fimbrial biogenesis chaperone n=1 Tax=Acinetobacter sp. 'aerobic (ED)' TaxID=174230 RepID=UPI00192C6BA4|nr:molecular chaperone [Acinetobacter sp. 'aerobic (ED)']
MKFSLNLVRKHLSVGVFLLSLTSISSANAGVVLVGTRVILPNGQNEKTIYLQNKDNKPALVQVWLDAGDENSTLDTTKAPFVVNPQIFRMEGNASQIVRLRYLGVDTDSDSKESLYYLNFIQYPSVKVNETAVDNNRLMIVFKNRIKVFVRPKKINSFMSSSQAMEKLDFSFSPTKKVVVVNNPTPYFANIQEIGLKTGNQYVVLTQNKMVEPNSTLKLDVKKSNYLQKDSKIKFVLVNDYGVPVEQSKSIAFD